MAEALHFNNGASLEKRKQVQPGLANSFFYPAAKRIKQEENGHGYSPSPDLYSHLSESPPHASAPVENLFAGPVSPDEEHSKPIPVKFEAELEAISSDDDEDGLVEEGEELAKGKVVVPPIHPLQDCLAALGLLGHSSSGPPPAWLIRQPVDKPASLWTGGDQDATTRQPSSIKLTKSSTIPPKSGSAINTVSAAVLDVITPTASYELVGGSINGEVVFFGETPVHIDTKGGPIISLIVHTLIPYQPKIIITGDSNGNVTFVSRDQILTRKSIGAPITCLCVHTDQVGSKQVIAADATGVLTAFTRHDHVWRAKVGGHRALNPPSKTYPSLHTQPNPSIRCITPCTWPRQDGGTTSTILVCDGSPCVYVVVGGRIVETLNAPCVMNATCTGFFCQSVRTQINLGISSSEQILFGGTDGCVYLLDQYKFHLYAKTDHVITTMHTCKSNEKDGPDLLIVGSLSAFLYIFSEGNVSATQP
ncbi:hypothetical protein HK097_002683 [Rhizophlyctis rosea]|uniref:Uncharacterized protein n=1 Tax=Rhizophlyctis rosea TaxID=64517 RepID=A0AAD5SGD4_9FUNG|nr:hypothetical protein HK097_002683 [Rhizophlyctis rosea]